MKLVLPLLNAVSDSLDSTHHAPIQSTGGTGEPEDLVRVIVADDHALVRESICGILAKYEDIEVVGEASDGRDAIQLASRLHPDIVLMDVTMPQVDGFEATRKIKQQHPSMIVIGISVHNDQRVEAGMREAGASAFLNKEVVVDKLYETVRAVLDITKSNVLP